MRLQVMLETWDHSYSNCCVSLGMIVAILEAICGQVVLVVARSI